jgi:hypothetical protein
VAERLPLPDQLAQERRGDKMSKGCQVALIIFMAATTLDVVMQSHKIKVLTQRVENLEKIWMEAPK